MAKIVYYVASSIDGFISGADGDISGFVSGGNGVDKYLSDLKSFKTVIMGRRTYEFGYQFGLEPGDPAYPHMEHFIFSDSLKFENKAKTVHVERKSIDRVKEIKSAADTDVYLCGGGIFAGWLLDNELIDLLKIKVNPLILGQGVKIFGNSTKTFKLNLVEKSEYEDGLLINTYEIIYTRNT